MALSEEEIFSATYDHYKDTFSHIRTRENQRDRLFLWSIGVLAALALFSGYPQSLLRVIEASGKTNLPSLDLPNFVVSSIFWTFLLVLSVKYLQAGIAVERQYHYLHRIEEVLAGQAKNAGLFQREGLSYGLRYPMFSWWVWSIYTIGVPLIFLVSTTALIAGELVNRSGYDMHFLYDTAVCVAVNISFILRTFYSIKEMQKPKIAEIAQPISGTKGTP